MGAIEDVSPVLSHQTCEQVRRLLASDTPMVGFYANGIIDALRALATTVYKTDAMVLIENINARIVDQAYSALQSKAEKPAMIYRKYAPVLRMIVAEGGADADNARQVLADLYLEQTLPSNELETPDYVDGYTGEEIPEDEYEVSGVGNLLDSVKELEQSSNIAAADLGWNEETRKQFIAAQLGFNADADNIAITDDDRGYTPPIFMDKTDYMDDDEYELRRFITWYNQLRARLIARMKKDGVPASEWSNEWKLRLQPHTSPILRRLELIDDDEEWQTDMLAKCMRGLKLDARDEIEQVEYDEPRSQEEPDPNMIDPGFMDELAATCPSNARNPIETAAFNTAYVMAVAGGATLKEAQDIAWKKWRGRKVQISGIRQVKGIPVGVTLSDGRKIDWSIAYLKVKNNEIDFAEGRRQALKAKLTELNINNKFVQAL
jgi:hypothetical protein